MDIQRRFRGVHWIWGGGISFVYEVHPSIVVKVPKSGEFERQQFQKELEIYRVFTQTPPCPSIVRCFLLSESGIFLEYMRDASLSSRIQNNHTRDQQTMVVTTVHRLEPLSLRKEWMNDLAQAVAFLESLNLAHGDLRPENILLDRHRIKLSDFDCTAVIGTAYEACMAPYGRLLNGNEPDQGECGTSGFTGPRTEQFALGSLYYLINYGFEVYGDRCLTENPYDHGPKVVDLLQNMEFPKLNADPLIESIIDRCWHNKYGTIKELAAHTKTLLSDNTVVMESNGGGKNENEQPVIQASFIDRWCIITSRIFQGILHSLGVWWRSLLESIRGKASIAGQGYSNTCEEVNKNRLEQEILWKKSFCQDLVERGLLRELSSDEPERLAFTFDWYRYSRQCE